MSTQFQVRIPSISDNANLSLQWSLSLAFDDAGRKVDVTTFVCESVGLSKPAYIAFLTDITGAFLALVPLTRVCGAAWGLTSHWSQHPLSSSHL